MTLLILNMREHAVSHLVVPQQFKPKRQTPYCRANNTNPQVNFGESKEMQQEAASIFEVARPQGLVQEVGDGWPKGVLEWLFLNGISLVTQHGVQYCPIDQKIDLHLNRRNDVQVVLVFLLGVEAICAITGLSAQDEKILASAQADAGEFLQANYISLRSVEHQDRLLRVKRFQDGQEWNIYPPQHSVYLSGRMLWFFLDSQGERRCGL